MRADNTNDLFNMEYKGMAVIPAPEYAGCYFLLPGYKAILFKASVI